MAAVPPEEVHTCIIGAGMSGLCMALQLQARAARARRAAPPFVLLDAAADVGGTWLEAAGYPGAACDIPSHLYSYSFAQNAHWVRVCGCGWSGFERAPDAAW